ncbi:MAG: DUF819 family protein, partial [Myxococcota bacterium]
GVVFGAAIAYALVGRWLPPDSWQLFGALSGAWIGGTGNMAAVAARLPEVKPVLSTRTWQTLVLTTFTLGLSFTRARLIPGSRPAGLALVYLFLASMGARATIGGLGDAPVFLGAAFLWIAIHGLFLVIAARLLRVDLHTAAIASAANIGGAASGPVVAAHHREALVPASILMALIGYAAGNYLAVLTAQLCYWLSPG